MLAVRLADELAKRRREAGGVICPWELSTQERSDRESGLHGGNGGDGDRGQAGDAGSALRAQVLDTTMSEAELPTVRTALDLQPGGAQTIVFPPIDRPLRSGRARTTRHPAPVTPQTLPHTLSELIAQERTIAGQGYFQTPRELLGLPEPVKRPTGPWGFEEEVVKRFKALGRRNFCCVQEHQATAYHFDLRLQIDGGTFSWAVPKGFMDLKPGAWHYAVQTPVHPISYSVHEGSDGRVFKNGTRCGTLLWDICEYSIGSPSIDREQSPDSDKEESDELGTFEEDKLRHALYGRLPRFKKSRYIKLVLKNGRKFTNHSFTIFQTDATYDSRGNPKKQWIIKLGHGITEPHKYPEDATRSVKTGRLLKEVTAAGPCYWVPRSDEQAGEVEEGDLGDLQ